MQIQPARRTELEALFGPNAPSLRALESHVETRFDTQAGLFYEERIVALERPIQERSGFPSDQWIAETLESFVRTEFGTSGASSPIPKAPVAPVFAESAITNWDEVLYQYLESCERSLVYSGYGAAVARSRDMTTTERLYALFTHRFLGNAANRKNYPLDKFADTVGARVDAGERLLFVFPGFPFKDQNPFRTLGESWRPDLAEAALMIRLHALSLAIYQSYQLSSDWIILTDGTAFSSALRISEEETRRYHENILHLRNKLDIGRAVNFVNFVDLAIFLEGDKIGWPDCLAHIEARLAVIENEAGAPLLASLRRGMKRNVNLRDLRDELGWSDWWDILYVPVEETVVPSLRRKWREIDEVCRESALRYAAFNLASKWFQLDSALFPDAIRATIHPKRGQLAVPRIGSEFPWNGTAFVGGAQVNVASVGCRSIHEIGAKGRLIRRHVDADGEHVLFTSYAD